MWRSLHCINQFTKDCKSALLILWLSTVDLVRHTCEPLQQTHTSAQNEPFTFFASWWPTILKPTTTNYNNKKDLKKGLTYNTKSVQKNREQFDRNQSVLCKSLLVSWHRHDTAWRLIYTGLPVLLRRPTVPKPANLLRHRECSVAWVAENLFHLHSLKQITPCPPGLPNRFVQLTLRVGPSRVMSSYYYYYGACVSV